MFLKRNIRFALFFRSRIQYNGHLKGSDIVGTILLMLLLIIVFNVAIWFTIKVISKVWMKITLSLIFLAIIVFVNSLSFSLETTWKMRQLIHPSADQIEETLSIDEYAIVIESQDNQYAPNVFRHVLGVYFEDGIKVYKAEFENDLEDSLCRVYQMPISSTETYVLIDTGTTNADSIQIDEVDYSRDKAYFSFVITGEIDENSVILLNGISYHYSPQTIPSTSSQD